MRASIRALAFGAVLASGIFTAAPAAASCIGSFTFTGTIQTCTVDTTGTYALSLFGAQGGGSTGGLGAQAGGSILLSAGDELSILVGGQGGTTITASSTQLGHGGGGTMAGDAGGAGQAGTAGGTGTGSMVRGPGAPGGTGGSGGLASIDHNAITRAGGGGGWSGNGGGGPSPAPGGGASFLNGGAGGTAAVGLFYDTFGPGGFGGGGGSQVGAGGGGGYSGGGGGTGGGGGGSFLAAAVTDDVLVAGVRSGNGLVTIGLQSAVQTPEPGTLTLLAGALGMLALRRRARG